jgi:general secretion pathway protein A
MDETTDIRDHFHCRSLPFTRELSVDLRFVHPQYDEAARDLVEVVHDRMSGALIAPAGTGKTVVLRQLVDQLPKARFRVHDIKVTGLSKRDFCRELAIAVGARPAGHTGALVRSLQARCREYMDNESVRPVIIVDEAQDMRPDVLALLKLITNFDMDSRLVVSFILCGQPQLGTLLERPELEDVSRRIARYARLRSLSRDETMEYVLHRLHIAGAKADIFDRPAMDAVYECGQGNLRATDRIALEAMRQAARGSAPVVGMNHVIAARAKVAP